MPTDTTFVGMLNTTCDVYQPVPSADDYGESDLHLQVVDTDVACRLSILGKGQEFKLDKRVLIVNRKAYMLPRKLDHNNYLLIEGNMYNVVQVDNPSNLNHHYEVWLELIAVNWEAGS